MAVADQRIVREGRIALRAIFGDATSTRAHARQDRTRGTGRASRAAPQVGGTVPSFGQGAKPPGKYLDSLCYVAVQSFGIPLEESDLVRARGYGLVGKMIPSRLCCTNPLALAEGEAFFARL